MAKTVKSLLKINASDNGMLPPIKCTQDASIEVHEEVIDKTTFQLPDSTGRLGLLL